MQMKLYLNAGKTNDLNQGCANCGRDVFKRIKTKFKADWRRRLFFLENSLILGEKLKNPRQIHNEDQYF